MTSSTRVTSVRTAYKLSRASFPASCFKASIHIRTKRPLSLRSHKTFYLRENMRGTVLHVWLCFLLVPRATFGSHGNHHLSASRDVVKRVCRCTKGAQLFGGVDSGDNSSHNFAVEKKTDAHQVKPCNRQSRVSVEAVNVVDARAQRKPPRAQESKTNASSLCSVGWKSGRCEGVSYQCDQGFVMNNQS